MWVNILEPSLYVPVPDGSTCPKLASLSPTMVSQIRICVAIRFASLSASAEFWDFHVWLISP